MKITSLCILVLMNILPGFLLAQEQNRSTTLSIDLNKEIGTMEPVWAWFGYDECNYTYMKDGQKLLSEIASLSPVPVYVRVHNILTSHEGMPGLKWGSTNAYAEDKNGNPVYDWTIVDQIFDTYRERGMKPIVELGFMPEALSTHPKPYRHGWPQNGSMDQFATGWAYPPKDYNKWAELVFQMTKHCIQRYGQKEVESWYWEVWNEPDIPIYFKEPQEVYFKMYDYAVGAVKKACPKAQVGGPTTTSPREPHAAMFLHDFMEHCQSGMNYATGKKGSDLDYITFHAKGQPKTVDNHVQMNINLQLMDLVKGFEVISSFDKFKGLPVIIGESDPEGCAACSGTPNLTYRNGTMYPSYQAAAFARKYALADSFKINLKGVVTWAFEFEDQRWFDGFRDLATNGVDKPVLNVYRMFGMMNGMRVKVSGGNYDLPAIVEKGVKGSAPDINALAAKDEKSITVMVWNYHDEDMPAPSSPVDIIITGLTTSKVMIQEYRIDKEHSNSFEAWKEMGSPQHPDQQQYARLEKAGQLDLFSSPEWKKTDSNKVVKRVVLPRQSVSLLKFTW